MRVYTSLVVSCRLWGHLRNQLWRRNDVKKPRPLYWALKRLQVDHGR